MINLEVGCCSINPLIVAALVLIWICMSNEQDCSLQNSDISDESELSLASCSLSLGH